MKPSHCQSVGVCQTHTARGKLSVDTTITCHNTITPALFARYPSLAGHARSLRFAVNGEYAKDDRLLGEGDDVAVIPPVAGG